MSADEKTVLPEPSLEDARRILKKAGPDDLFVGIRMSSATGSNPERLDSLAEVAGFIHIGSYEVMMQPNSRETVNYVDPSALEGWVRSVPGDEPLADAVNEIVVRGEAFGFIAHELKALLQDRVDQCRAVVAAAEQSVSNSEN